MLKKVAVSVEMLPTKLAGFSLMVGLMFWSAPLTAGTVGSLPPPGRAPVTTPAGGFAIDGNLFANTPTAGIGDWLPESGADAGGSVLDSAGRPLNNTMTFHLTDPYSANDMVFNGGLKWYDDPNTWGWNMGKSSAKTDINNVLVHITTDADGHIWAIVAADRLSTSGDSYIDFEFLQNPLIRKSDGTFQSAGPHGGRTTNDLLLSLEISGGGSAADFFALRWAINSNGVFGYVDSTAAVPKGKVFAALNSTTIAVPYGAFGQTTYSPNAFAEAAVDLTALLGNFDPCLSLGVKTIMVKTKASQSDSATIEDFIDPIQYTLQIGPAADAGSAQVRCSEGELTAFPLHGSASAGIFPIASTTWSVISGNAIIDASNSLITTAHISSGSATLRLTVVENNGCTISSDVVLAVAPPAACSITGPAAVCPAVSVQFQGSAGKSVYAWSISGNGEIVGANNAQSVMVRAGTACGESFSLMLNTVSNGCPATCDFEVQVNDATQPALSCPPDRTLECPADTRTNVTGVATATDDCGSVNVQFEDVASNGCVGSKVIARTWTAMDRCGNIATAVQTITVRDTVKPVLSCPQDVVLECPADTSTARTGLATAQDTCSQVVVQFSDAESKGCGGSKVIARTWTATDECGNSSSAVQTITVRDTGKPTLACPADVVLECPADTRTNVTGVAMAEDTCSQVVVSYTDAVSTSCGGTKIIARTWSATDECGNSSSAVQKITVRDTGLPTLICPADVVLDCPADTKTNVTGIATATDGCSKVTVSYTDVVSNNCGGTKVIARTWTASDECGNMATVVQTITIRDILKPTLICPPNVVLECPADVRTNATGVATASDTCSQVSIRYADATNNACGNTKVITRTWTASDECGNSASAVQTITVRDTIAPVVTCPTDLVLECPADIRTNVTGVATPQDGCGRVILTYNDAVRNSCGGTKTVTRTWIATDECGNVSRGTQTITVIDTTAPAIICPADVAIECGADTRTNATGVATALDGCGSVTIKYSDSISNNCGGSKVIARLWTATDGCGNASQAVQTITVRDTTPPSLKLPDNVVMQCPGDTRPSVTGNATAVDVCGSATITYSDVVSNGCGLTRTVLRQWTATDQCGNSANGMQTISVMDTQKPSISCRAISVQCVGDVPVPYANLAAFLAGGGTASDSCDAALTFALISDSGLVGSCPGKVTRVYRVTDDCGNFGECAQTITVDDTIAPVLTVPTNITVECGIALDPANTGAARATDNCDNNVSIRYSDLALTSEYEIKFFAADPGVNSAPYLPTYLKLSPNSLPVPADARSGRAADPLRNAVAFGPTSSTLDALTSLGGEPMSFGQIVPFEVVIGAGPAPGNERGTIDFTANWSTHTTSNDRFGYDTNYMVYAAFVDYADQGTRDPHQNARVDSFKSTLINAGTIDEKIQGTFRVSGLDINDQVVVEIWMVLRSTASGNFGGTIASDLVSAQKVLTPPVPISIGNQTVSIGNLSKITSLPAPQAQPPLGPLPVQPPVLPGRTTAVINRTWTATDTCGNASSAVQTITIRDTQPPTMVSGANQTLPFGSTWNFTEPVATDAGGAVTVRVVSTVTNLLANNTLVATRIWEAVDASGNRSTCQQTVTMTDVPRTVLSVQWVEPDAVILSWSAAVPGFQLMASDTLKDWAAVPVAPQLRNGNYVVELTSTSRNMNFRLYRP